LLASEILTIYFATQMATLLLKADEVTASAVSSAQPISTTFYVLSMMVKQTNASWLMASGGLFFGLVFVGFFLLKRPFRNSWQSVPVVFAILMYGAFKFVVLALGQDLGRVISRDAVDTTIISVDIFVIVALSIVTILFYQETNPAKEIEAIKAASLQGFDVKHMDSRHPETVADWLLYETVASDTQQL
jgi:hypothetical protein